jgi:CMP-N,N'-diacetyllegionaminic acid synthase
MSTAISTKKLFKVDQISSNSLSVLAIIPARGGSKGIPLKNIYPINGKPLILFSIEAALNSQIIDHVVVSTDNDQIASIASGYKSIKVIHRPDHLAQDSTPTLPVLLHVLDQFIEEKKPEIIITLQPTSPLRTSEHIDDAIRLLTTDFDSCISVCESEHSPYKMFTLQQGLLMKLFDDVEFGVPRQLLPKVYRESGAVYVTWVETLIQKKSIWGEKIIPYVMEQEDSIDIDTISDIKIAEIILKKKQDKK